ncbi:MAG: hypothetical protein OET90_08490, partial [Desulfuromonadales bacterium]|nr:hypothetical protein [Desulfuromonadales bacterium]
MKSSEASHDNIHSSWVDVLNEGMQQDRQQTPLLERKKRYLLIAKARWFFLAIVALYGGGAAIGYAYSDYGWFLTSSQAIGMSI